VAALSLLGVQQRPYLLPQPPDLEVLHCIAWPTQTTMIEIE
jgi:hypothetical protein